MIDLHIHTTASDGEFSPASVVEMAKENGITTMAITDHDTVAGIAPALEVAQEKGIRLIPGIELSSVHRAEVHILGYGIDYKSPGLLRRLEQLANKRMERAKLMLERLKRLGIKLTLADINGEGVFGRGNLARAMVRLGLVTNTAEAFEKYLGKGRPAYVEHEKLSPAEAIQLVNKYGGIAVLAHPKQCEMDDVTLEQFIMALTKKGLGGVEAYYPGYWPQDTQRYEAMARRNNIAVTCGSDFHGFYRTSQCIGASCALYTPTEAERILLSKGR